MVTRPFSGRMLAANARVCTACARTRRTREYMLCVKRQEQFGGDVTRELSMRTVLYNTGRTGNCRFMTSHTSFVYPTNAAIDHDDGKVSALVDNGC
jgi:hypothetical protein